MAENHSQSQKASGSIRRRGDTYQVRVYAGVNPETGKPHYLEATEADADAADRTRTKFLAQVAAKRAPLSNKRFEAHIRAWLESRRDDVDAGELDPATFAKYEQLARDHVIPVLGGLASGELEQQLVPEAERLYRLLRKCRLRCGKRLKTEHHPSGQGNNRVLKPHELEGHTCGKRCKPHQCAGMSPSSLRKVHGVVIGTCAMLFRWGSIETDLGKRILTPKKPQARPKAPPTTDVAALIRAAFEQDADWGATVWLLLVTGARRSEIARSQLQDIDFARNMIYIDSRKVDGTDRWVALDEHTMQLLTALRSRIETRLAAAGLALTGEEYLHSYATDHSRPGSLSYFSHRFSKMGAALGIKTHPHALRHYAATELVAGGVDIVSVARRLGHKAPSTTSDIYAAWRPEADNRAVGILTSGLELPSQTDRQRTQRDYSAEQPNRTGPEIEKRICDLRRRTDWGPKRIKAHLAAEEITIAESTIWNVLRRHGLSSSTEVIDAG